MDFIQSTVYSLSTLIKNYIYTCTNTSEVEVVNIETIDGDDL